MSWGSLATSCKENRNTDTIANWCPIVQYGTLLFVLPKYYFFRLMNIKKFSVTPILFIYLNIHLTRFITINFTSAYKEIGKSREQIMRVIIKSFIWRIKAATEFCSTFLSLVLVKLKPVGTLVYRIIFDFTFMSLQPTPYWRPQELWNGNLLFFLCLSVCHPSSHCDLPTSFDIDNATKPEVCGNLHKEWFAVLWGTPETGYYHIITTLGTLQ